MSLIKSILSAIKLDKNIPIPLYYQLKKQMLDMIEHSELKSGDMLPAENDLCDLLKVSRPTIRQAFRELVNEGYLNRYKGKGTFVAAPKVKDQFLSRLESFNQEMQRKGVIPKTNVLELRKIPGDPEFNESLGLPFDAPLIQLSRVRSVDGIPMVYVDTYLSFDHYAGILDIDFTVKSLYEVLESQYNTRVIRAQREIEAVNARKREADLLEVSQNKAICLVKTISYYSNTSNSDLPVEFSIARYRGDSTKFTVDIYR